MVSFAEYAFNKSHAAAYAVIAYETGYLKAHYPVEFMAALMTSVMGDAPYIARYIRNCNDMGISVLPPDVNKSGKKFSVDNGQIRFGLMGVKNVGEGIVDAIIKARKEKGTPKDIVSFIQQIDSRELNKKALESLIKAGAFDEMHDNRAQLIAMSEGLLTSAQNDARKNIAGQVSLFGASGSNDCVVPNLCIPFPDIRNFDKKVLMTMEKENLGVYLSDHPLNALRKQIERRVSLTSDQLVRAGEEEIDDVHDGMAATVAGIIVAKKTLVTKSGQMMAFIDIEDFFGIIEVVVFPKTYESSQQFLIEDNIIEISGTVNFKEEETPKILANKILLMDEEPILEEGKEVAEKSDLLKVKIPSAGDSEGEIEGIKDIFQCFPGDCPVMIYVEETGKKFRATKEFWVQPCDELMERLASRVGIKNVKMCGGKQ
jgi:DNA polymerase-3 subunit alpha